MLARTSRALTCLLAVLGLVLTLTSAPVAAQPGPKKYAIAIRYVAASDTVVGSAKKVGGEWYLMLEWRRTKKDSWQGLAGGPQQGRKKATASNVVRSPGFDFSGQWRTCVLKNAFERDEKKTCGKVLTVR